MFYTASLKITASIKTPEGIFPLDSWPTYPNIKVRWWNLSVNKNEIFDAFFIINKSKIFLNDA